MDPQDLPRTTHRNRPQARQQGSWDRGPAARTTLPRRWGCRCRGAPLEPGSSLALRVGLCALGRQEMRPLLRVDWYPSGQGEMSPLLQAGSCLPVPRATRAAACWALVLDSGLWEL